MLQPWLVWGVIIFGWLVIVAIIAQVVNLNNRMQRQEDITIAHGLDLRRVVHKVYGANDTVSRKAR